MLEYRLMANNKGSLYIKAIGPNDEILEAYQDLKKSIIKKTNPKKRR